MKNQFLISLLLLLLGFVSVYAQGHGKIGIRVAGGISSLHDDVYKFSPIPAYAVGLILGDKDKPFSIRGELAFESKGAYLDDIPEKLDMYYLSLHVLPQIKFKASYKHALMVGPYIACLTNRNVSKKLGQLPVPDSFSILDLGLTTAYKYQFKTTAKYNFQIDARFNYGFYNINPSTFGESKWTHNIVAQLGLNFVLNK